MQTQVFAPRLGKDENNHILVVYDRDQRYRQICLDMASESRHVVDASESSIISRGQGASLRRSSTERSSTFNPVLTPASDGFSIAHQVLRCFLKTFTFRTSKDNFWPAVPWAGRFYADTQSVQDPCAAGLTTEFSEYVLTSSLRCHGGK